MKDTVIKLIIKLADIDNYLVLSKDLALINSVILEKPVHNNLIERKKRYPNNVDGSVKQNYWKSFLKRKSHRIVSKIL